MRVEESIEIASAPEEVWAVVADPLNDPRWCSKVKSVKSAGESSWILTHKPVPLRPPVEMTIEHLQISPPSRLILREEDDASIFDVEYRIEASPGGARFTQVSEFEWKRLPRILHGTFARGVRRDVRGQLKSLKSLLEDGAAR